MSSINKVATLHIGLKLPRTEQPHRAVVTLYACKNGKIFSRPGKGTDGNLLFLCLLCAVFPGWAGRVAGRPTLACTRDGYLCQRCGTCRQLPKL